MTEIPVASRSVQPTGYPADPSPLAITEGRTSAPIVGSCAAAAVETASTKTAVTTIHAHMRMGIARQACFAHAGACEWPLFSGEFEVLAQWQARLLRPDYRARVDCGHLPHLAGVDPDRHFKKAATTCQRL